MTRAREAALKTPRRDRCRSTKEASSRRTLVIIAFSRGLRCPMNGGDRIHTGWHCRTCRSTSTSGTRAHSIATGRRHTTPISSQPHARQKLTHMAIRHRYRLQAAAGQGVANVKTDSCRILPRKSLCSERQCVLELIRASELPHVAQQNSVRQLSMESCRPCRDPREISIESSIHLSGRE